MFATIEDVAQAAGCSTATVSRVMNGFAQVSPDVRARVSAAVKKTGYKPRRRHTPKVHREPEPGMQVVNILFYRSVPYEPIKLTEAGVQVGALHPYHADDLRNPQFRQSNSFEQGLLDGMLAACSHFRLKASILSTDNLQDETLLREVGDPAQGGLIIGGIYPDGLEAFLAKCSQPVVLLDMLPAGAADAVTSDNFGGICNAVRRLVALGHTQIGFIGVHTNPSYYERYLGFLAAMSEAGLAVNPAFVQSSRNGHIAETVEDLRPMLARKQRPTAFVAGSDFLAMAAIEAAQMFGMSVPGDLSVIGFDDVSVAPLTQPPLTTVHVSTDEIGWRAVAQLLTPKHPDSAQLGRGIVVRVGTTLVERETCAPPRETRTAKTTGSTRLC